MLAPPIAMCRVIVFLGPTLGLAVAQKELAADYRPPAIRGDIYRAGIERPDAILLIDGIFASRPAVMHKEILWVLSQGIPVWGTSSLGALRAAELNDDGMQGWGRVFTDYRDGHIEDDDEVAVQHGPAELSWMPTSVAMIDIRYCLSRACAEGIIDGLTLDLALTTAKRLYFPERSYRRILNELGASLGPVPQIAALRRWLLVHVFSQKAMDAASALGAIGQVISMAPRRTFDADFPTTMYWQYHARHAVSVPTERRDSL